ncbi:hypothetical protein HRR83_006377 [Exophiala dermatitidis]|uniref:Uncharacterized protein n=2 Tax=Exophiala dermatitidis TaxID=5970 RepID=H6CA54_EXODN|nr:uncharacterized protein HMPREF1120_07993 [Exophiala dermatitidis NIH/UT8656]KAJ4509381.1 hypothetical protein HRR73_007235 [Exophiala dermatitidis]EHY60018.1 hypothetical protein HMPREF1120_07993 [Exophiala dermatitidis NIH/UT8656]KAJ4509568.1 hypothetical protein HRR74_007349 [Exophiala dermatitidis]KAJ4530572.1 hypothetical protein HRR76_008276 [Exophiala dermatitidis]KAJ4545258.1 hypothetical protein HRR77_005111 [Exophiala dermatitidis]
MGWIGKPAQLPRADEAGGWFQRQEVWPSEWIPSFEGPVVPVSAPFTQLLESTEQLLARKRPIARSGERVEIHDDERSSASALLPLDQLEWSDIPTGGSCTVSRCWGSGACALFAIATVHHSPWFALQYYS